MSDNRNPEVHDRSFEDGDWIARQFLSPEDLRQSPEEYAARHAHLWGCFSLHQYRYMDANLGAWIRRLGEILSSQEEMERCRRRFLTDAESSALRQEETEY